MFSRMQAPRGSLGLGPVAVLSAHRRRGVAASLIRKGLAQSKADGWAAVFVLGDPAYYGRFGFSPTLAAGFTSTYAGPHLMGLNFRPKVSRRERAPSDIRRHSPIWSESSLVANFRLRNFVQTCSGEGLCRFVSGPRLSGLQDVNM